MTARTWWVLYRPCGCVSASVTTTTITDHDAAWSWLLGDSVHAAQDTGWFLKRTTTRPGVADHCTHERVATHSGVGE